MIRFLLFASMLLAAATQLVAQDLHFSQFYLHPLHQNPAQTGVFRGDWRASALYRSQWNSVPVAYQTVGGAADIKVLRNKTNLVAVGLVLQHDQAGDAVLQWNQLGVNVGVSQALGERQALSGGFGLSVAQRSFDISALRFKNQWDGDIFNPGLSNNEQFNKSSGFVPTLSAGLNWRLERDDEARNVLQAGVGAFHLNRPKVNFADDADQHLPVRMAVALNGSQYLNEYFDLVAYALYHQMSTSREIQAGIGGRYWLDETALQLSMGLRLGDALVPALQVERGSWTVGLSYDWNISEFDVATNNRGGFEVGVVYRSLTVPPVKTLKVCPIF